jgi:hypothetical protein
MIAHIRSLSPRMREALEALFFKKLLPRVRPPDNTIGSIEAGIIRYCRVGAGMTLEAGVPGTNTRASRLFKMLAAWGFMEKREAQTPWG